MRTRVIQGLSLLLLILAVFWFIAEGGYEPVITALAGLVGLFSIEFLKSESISAVGSAEEQATISGHPRPETPGRNSILVLPFDNLSPDPGDAYFSDGLTEEIITNLSRLRSLRVISRNSAMVLKESQKDTRTIAADLGVQYVLEGSVRKVGSDLRITAQLIAAETDEHLWAESYDGVLHDVFGIQEKVSRSIVEALTLNLSPEEDQELAQRPFDDPTAYDCYLRARQEYWKVTPESLKAAHRHVRNGLQIVGENELLLATMGYVTMQRITFGIAAAPEHLPEAEALAEKVFSMNPDSPHGHTLCGWIRFKQGRPVEAVQHLKEALRIQPGLIEALLWLNVTYLSAGKEGAAAPYVQELLRIDPLTPAHHSLSGYWHYLRGENAKALVAYRRMAEMDPGIPFTQVLYGRMMVLLGEAENAREHLERVIRAASENPMIGHGIVLLHLLNGRLDEATAAITPALEEASWYDEHLSWWMGEWLAYLGREEEAVHWLRRAADLGLINWPALNELDSFLDPIRQGPLFVEFLEQVRVRWEAFDP